MAPNPIDFDKVVTEFSRLRETGNVAVIAAIGCVFGVYLLLLTWARKYDKLDHLKVNENIAKISFLQRQKSQTLALACERFNFIKHSSLLVESLPTFLLSFLAIRKERNILLVILLSLLFL